MTGDPLLTLLRGGGPPPPGDPEWERLADQAVAEGATGTTLSLIARAGQLENIPPAARSRLESDLRSVRASQTMLFSRFQDLSACLARAGVPFIVHKGGALAVVAYPRPEDRPMVDIDVIFRPTEWERVRDALSAAGYRLPPGARQEFWLENYFNLSVMSPGDPPSHFDLHWSLTQEGRYHVATEDLFSRAVPFEMGSTSLLRLGDEDLLLSLFLHLAYHYFEARLLWLYDMKLIIERWRIDWDRLFARAGQWGLLTVTALNLEFVERTYPGTVPAGVLARAKTGPLRRLALRPLASSSPRHIFRGEDKRLNQFVLGLASIDRPGDAFKFAADKVARSIRWMGRRPKRR
ncbi:MAG TPA: nucleotidyltransferase family protein [Candidatus Polarisedimenticolia bacterium]|nr:nucleotidyltransferase family protein [Candidatus Polarisedimenticolia bacterium]